MAWWHEAKFGMFVHWGIYSVPAGEYNGKTQPNSAEWIMNRGRIPIAEYGKFAAQFNPTQFNAEEFVLRAKSAGMKYIVITAKHHDGFSMFGSKASSYNVVDATPFKRDVMKELSNACQKHGMRFGFYYSQAQDWHHPGGMGNTWDKDLKRVSTDEYIREKAIPEVKQLLTGYGPIGIFWWDTPRKMSKESMDGLSSLTALQPGIITNDRLGEGYPGDHQTFERKIPVEGAAGQNWEVCMPISGSWGFKSSDTSFLTPTTLIRNLVDIASKGGNYLLNVSPTAQGTLLPASIERLKAIGEWMKVNGEAIYGTTASPFPALPWGRCTQKLTASGGSLYLHVFDWPADGKLTLPGLRSKVQSARLLASGQAVAAKSAGDSMVFSLEGKAPDAIASVIEVKLSEPLQVAALLPAQKADGSIKLSVAIADLHSEVARHATLKAAGDVWAADWLHPDAPLSWQFKVTKPGTYTVRAVVSGAGGGKLKVAIGASSAVGEITREEKGAKRTVVLGTLTLTGAGVQTLTLTPENAGWTGFRLHHVELLP